MLQPVYPVCPVQNLHKGVIRDEELYRMKLAEQKLLAEQKQTSDGR